MSTQLIDQRRPMASPRMALLLNPRYYYVFVYALIAFPIGLIAILMGVIGNWKASTRIQSRFIALLNAPESQRDSPRRRSQPVIHALLAIPFNLVAFLPTWIMSILMVVRGFCYPLVTDRETLSTSWGGPTVLGAWVAHFAVGLVCLVGVMIFLKILAKAQRRLAHRYLAAH